MSSVAINSSALPTNLKQPQKQKASYRYKGNDEKRTGSVICLSIMAIGLIGAGTALTTVAATMGVVDLFIIGPFLLVCGLVCVVVATVMLVRKCTVNRKVDPALGDDVNDSRIDVMKALPRPNLEVPSTNARRQRLPSQADLYDKRANDGIKMESKGNKVFVEKPMIAFPSQDTINSDIPVFHKKDDDAQYKDISTNHIQTRNVKEMDVNDIPVYQEQTKKSEDTNSNATPVHSTQALTDNHSNVDDLTSNGAQTDTSQDTAMTDLETRPNPLETRTINDMDIKDIPVHHEQPNKSEDTNSNESPLLRRTGMEG